jgi:Zn-finger nucleic acid-binding protein
MAAVALAPPASGKAGVGTVTLDECLACGGLWVDPPSFERICAEREEQAVVLRADLPVPNVLAPRADRYWPCPACGHLMNRQNFARLSGVIVDVCKGHGVWFNAGELQAIVEFIRAGGMERSRAQQKAEYEEARRKLHPEPNPQAIRGASVPLYDLDGRHDHGDFLSAARHLLRDLFFD